jgi:hypothetical protein
MLDLAANEETEVPLSFCIHESISRNAIKHHIWTHRARAKCYEEVFHALLSPFRVVVCMFVINDLIPPIQRVLLLDMQRGVKSGCLHA